MSARTSFPNRKKIHGLFKPGLISFTPALAHEIRNPLTNIKLSVEMLSLLLHDSEQKIYVDIISRSVQKIETLVKDLLTMQKANDLQSEKYAMNALLDEVIDSSDDRIRLKHVTVTKNFTPEDQNLILDRPKMKIALSNIVSNAIEAMDPDKGKLDIVTKVIDGKYILLIKDNGCGISMGNLKNIFRPYFTTKPDGLGVGLASTYAILRANNIRVNVESEPGKGTSFILLFDKEKKEINRLSHY